MVPQAQIHILNGSSISVGATTRSRPNHFEVVCLVIVVNVVIVALDVDVVVWVTLKFDLKHLLMEIEVGWVVG